MRRVLISLLLTPCLPALALAGGVCFRDASEATILAVLESDVRVEVENQVAVTASTQRFRNDSGDPFTITYAFPLHESASATDLSWRVDGGEWVHAVLKPTEPDSIPGEGAMDPTLASYLGATPLVFTCAECNPIPDGAEFEVRLDFVELLPYRDGLVSYHHPNDYSSLQTWPLDLQQLFLSLNSLRAIEDIELISHEATHVVTGAHHAEIGHEVFEDTAFADYEVRYSLSLSDLGLFGMSTMLPPEQIPDHRDRGFFSFVAEPDPSEGVVVDKVFTFVVDRSGSMGGEKIEQARDAARFVVANLNEGDRFNVVSFSSVADAVSDEHLPFTQTTRELAFTYIDRLNAHGLTSISGAFELAVPQFATATENTANIIIFFTDGHATAGIQETEPLLQHVNQLITDSGAGISLFTFGIGSHADAQLLSLLASQNNGRSRMLADEDLLEVISEFYLTIRNPVLIDVSLTFDPPGAVTELYPDPLPNLYQGRQMIVSGRYSTPGPITIRLDGQAFDRPVSFSYDLDLAATPELGNAFLTKLWAKSKIDHLLVRYYGEDPESALAQEIMDEIIALSISFGVASPFTYFTGDETPIDEETGDELEPGSTLSVPYQLVGNHPNPFNPHTTISFVVREALERVVFVRIYDLSGRLIRVLSVHVGSAGPWSVVWDGRLAEGVAVASGVYLYAVDFGDAVLVGKMQLLR